MFQVTTDYRVTILILTIGFNALNDLVREHDYDLVIPCNDFAVVPLQLERNKLNKTTNWYLINDEAFAVAFDKSRTNQLARELGVSVPTELSLSNRRIQDMSRESAISEIDRWKIEFPVFVKPRSSITQENLEDKRSAQKVDSAEELAEVFRASKHPDGLLLQECFEGEGAGVEVLASNGRILMEMQHRRLRETIDGGSTYRETIPRNEELAAAASKMVQHLDYTGVAMFEFRINRESGRWVLLENQRQVLGFVTAGDHSRRRFSAWFIRIVGLWSRRILNQLPAGSSMPQSHRGSTRSSKTT